MNTLEKIHRVLEIEFNRQNGNGKGSNQGSAKDAVNGYKKFQKKIDLRNQKLAEYNSLHGYNFNTLDTVTDYQLDGEIIKNNSFIRTNRFVDN